LKEYKQMSETYTQCDTQFCSIWCVIQRDSPKDVTALNKRFLHTGIA